MSLIVALGDHPDAIRGAINWHLEQARHWELEGNLRKRAEYIAIAADLHATLTAIALTPDHGEADPVLVVVSLPSTWDARMGVACGQVSNMVGMAGGGR